jgi:hypothetical protein
LQFLDVLPKEAKFSREYTRKSANYF